MLTEQTSNQTGKNKKKRIKLEAKNGKKQRWSPLPHQDWLIGPSFLPRPHSFFGRVSWNMWLYFLSIILWCLLSPSLCVPEDLGERRGGNASADGGNKMPARISITRLSFSLSLFSKQDVRIHAHHHNHHQHHPHCLTASTLHQNNNNNHNRFNDFLLREEVVLRFGPWRQFSVIWARLRSPKCWTYSDCCS